MPAPHTWAALATTALCTLRTQVSARGLHHKGVRGGGMRGNTLPPLAAVRRFYTQPALTAPSSGWGVAVCGEYPVHLRVCCWPCCTCLLITGSHGMMYTPASCSIYIKHLPDQVCTAPERSCIARSHVRHSLHVCGRASLKGLLTVVICLAGSQNSKRQPEHSRDWPCSAAPKRAFRVLHRDSNWSHHTAQTRR